VIEIPCRLRRSVEEDDDPARRVWLATLPQQIMQLTASWSLVIEEPLLPAGSAHGLPPPGTGRGASSC
jgi:hypothetical protein